MTGRTWGVSRMALVFGMAAVFAVAAADGGLLASFPSNVKASVFITSISFALYVLARLAGPLARDRRRRRRHQDRSAPAPAQAAAGPVHS